MKVRSVGFFVTVVAISCSPVHAHEMRPGYLEIRETKPEIYNVLWKVPARDTDQRLSLNLRFADDVEILAEPVSGFMAGAHIQRMQIRRTGGLAGTVVTVDGLPSTFTDALLRLERLDGTVLTHRLTPSSPSTMIPAEPNRLQVAEAYTKLGIEHILSGIDHLLFVACVMFVAGTRYRLLIAITGFTLAHSVTLVLSALGRVQLPVPPVEAAIALSIVFVAAEIARGQRGSLTFRYPIAVSASFGLLHGFGFAAVLREIGLPRNEIATALLCFNIGVEVGQVLFVAGLIAALHCAGRMFAGTADHPARFLAERLRVPAAYVVGSVASYWLIARIGSFVYT
jgi:hydrogenase/urease accessory protein HupE